MRIATGEAEEDLGKAPKRAKGGRKGGKARAARSLQAGFITSAAKRGANLFKICDTSGHKSLEMLRTYVRDAELFTDHAGAGLL